MEGLAASRTAQCAGEFLIGITQLAQGDRAAARKHFQACSELRVVRTIDDYMSRAILAQLDREPAWPQWIVVGGLATDGKSLH